MQYRRKNEEAESAPLRRTVQIVIVLGREVAGQVVVNGIIGQPLQGGLRRTLGSLIWSTEGFDVHHKRPVPRKIHSLLRHDYLAVEMGTKVNHRDELPGTIMPDIVGYESLSGL